MKMSVERESGAIFLAVREIGGKAVTLRFFPNGANVLGALLTHAASATDDYTGSECTIRGEMVVENEKSSPIP